MVKQDPKPTKKTPKSNTPDKISSSSSLEEEKPEDQTENQPNIKLIAIGDTLRSNAIKWAPAFRILILGMICSIALLSRVFSVIRYESIIHEFDPWFNFRATKILTEKGYYDFKYWIDKEAWHPLGRYSGHTLFPGLMLTAGAIHKFLNTLLIPIEIRNVCVFTAPLFSALTSILAYLLAYEISGKKEAGLFCALFMAVVPSYMSRSVAGSYDNEAVAIFAIVLCFYTFVRSIRTGTMFHGLISAFALYYMVLAWGGYVFVLGTVPIFVLATMIMGKFNIRVYVAYNIFYVIGSLYALTMPFVGIWQVWSSSEHLPSHVVFIIMQGYYFALFIKGNLSEQKYKFLSKVCFRIGAIACACGLIWVVVMGVTTWGHRILTLINPVYAKKHNPLVASISEHQSTAWGSFFFDLHFLLMFAPAGVYFLFKKQKNTNPKIFMGIYFVLSVYFSAIMIR